MSKAQNFQIYQDKPLEVYYLVLKGVPKQTFTKTKQYRTQGTTQQHAKEILNNKNRKELQP